MYYCRITQTERIKGKESKMKLEEIEVSQTIVDKFRKTIEESFDSKLESNRKSMILTYVEKV